MPSQLRTVCLLVLVLSATALSAGRAEAAAQLHATPQNAFVDPGGQPVPLRGFNVVPVWSTAGSTWGAAQYERIRDKGFNAVRFVLYWDDFEPSRGSFNAANLATLDTAIARAKAAGLYVVLDMVHLWGSGGMADVPAWAKTGDSVSTVQANAGDYLRMLASRYRDEPAVAAYDPVSEFRRWPIDQNGVLRAYDELIRQIRSVDPEKIVLVEPSYGDTSIAPGIADLSLLSDRRNVVWSIHDFFAGGDDDGYTASGAQAGAYVGSGTTGYPTRSPAELERHLLVHLDRAREAGMPMWIGAFGIGDGVIGHDEFIEDKVALYRKYRLGYAWWEYRSSAPFSAVASDGGWKSFVDRLVPDRTPPDTTLSAAPEEDAAVSSRSASFAFEADEPAATFECRIDAAPFAPCDSPATLSDLSEGVHVFEVRAVDAWGNADPTPVRRRWAVDLTAPQTAIDAGPSGLTAGRSATFDFSSDEPDAAFECSLDDPAFEACGSPHELREVAEGDQTLAVRAVDRAGNADPTPERRSWTVDATAPDTTITSAPNPATRSSQAGFAFSSDDPAASFRCRVDAGELEPCASPRVLADVSEGEHVFEVVAVDPAGNADPSPARHRWTVDTTPPKTTITSAPAALVKTNSASFGFSANEPQATFKCRRDAGAWSACTSPKRYASLTEGPHTFEVRATDAAGNVDTAPPQRTWTIDLTPPSIELSAPSSGTTYTRDQTVAVAATAADPNGVTKVDFYDNGSLVRSDTTSPFGLSWTVNSSRAGTHRWTAKASDGARNSASSGESKVEVNVVAASRETEPVTNDGDAADDPAIWVDRDDPGRSTVIATDKFGGLAVHDLSGRRLHFYADSRPNNVDVRNDVLLGGERVDLVVTSDRANSSLRVYKVDPVTRGLEHVSARTLFAGDRLYGLCMHKSRTNADQYVFTTDDLGLVRQWQLVADGDRVDAREVRSFRVPTEPVEDSQDQLTEGCVADDETGAFYVAEEDVGIWRYGAEPGAGEERTRVDSTGQGGHLTADVEGLALYRAADGRGYLLASSQGDNSFSVYERGAGNAFVTRFGIGAAEVDQVGATDGIDVTNMALGDAFPNGLFIAHDGYNPISPSAHRQNFKLVPWERVARSMSRPLTVDPGWDPRRGD